MTLANCARTAANHGSTRPETSMSGASRSAGGESEGQLGALAGLTARGQLSAVGAGQLGRDGQPDPAAGDLFGPVAAPEAVEDVRQFLGRNADAGVADPEDGARRAAAGLDGDRAALGGE